MYDTHDLKQRLEQIDAVIAAGPYTDTWESLSHWRVPDWYGNAKFGIFIHWGVYSAAAYLNEWYPRNMYIQGTEEFKHHEELFGSHTQAGYKDYIPKLTAEHFDAAEWVRTFTEAGADYMIPVAEHHDGFQMYRSEVSHWNAYEMGPHRDVLGELKEAAGQAGLTMGASSHRIEHWWFLGGSREYDSDISALAPEPGEDGSIQPAGQRGDLYWPTMPSPSDMFDTRSTPWPSQEFLDDWLVRTCEIVDRFRPAVLYFDWWIQHESARAHLRRLAAYYYNVMEREGRTGVLCYKHDEFAFGCAVPDMERGHFAQAQPFVWQTDTAICHNSWCYTLQNRYKKAPDILRTLVDAVSKNGRLLLNVGPKPDGTLTAEESEVLRLIGAWMQVNGEALKGCTPYRICQEGPTQMEEGMFMEDRPLVYTPEDFRFFMNHGCLYAAALAPSADGTYRIRTLGRRREDGQPRYLGAIRRVWSPELKKELSFEMTDEALVVSGGPAEAAPDPETPGAPVLLQLELL